MKSNHSRSQVLVTGKGTGRGYNLLTNNDDNSLPPIKLEEGDLWACPECGEKVYWSRMLNHRARKHGYSKKMK